MENICIQNDNAKCESAQFAIIKVEKKNNQFQRRRDNVCIETRVDTYEILSILCADSQQRMPPDKLASTSTPNPIKT